MDMMEWVYPQGKTDIPVFRMRAMQGYAVLRGLRGGGAGQEANASILEGFLRF